jgi:hypothetical protein
LLGGVMATAFEKLGFARLVGLIFSEGANSAKIANVMMVAVASRVFQDITVISRWGAILLF